MSIDSNIWHKLEKIQNKRKEIIGEIPEPNANDIEEVVADKIFQTIPKDIVMHFNNAVDYVNRQTGIPTNLVSKGLVKAVSRKKFVTDSTGVYVRKNQL
jgi:hypothetical protein